ncbi:hypothetical protein OG216_07305 [Streptomycetaceae bacterium NBC_01309]
MRLHARFAAVAVALPLLGLTTACDSGQTKGKKETAPPNAGSPAGPGASGGASAPATSKSPPRTALTEAELKAARLTAVRGWQIMANDREFTPASPEKADNPECQPLLDLVAPEPSLQPDAIAVVTITKADVPGQINMGVGQFGPGRADKLFKDAAAALPKCSQFSGTNKNGSRIDYTAAAGAGATLGDATIRIDFTRAQGERKNAIPLVMVRSGSAAIQAMSIDTVVNANTAPPLPVSEELLELQLARLVEAQKKLV